MDKVFHLADDVIRCRHVGQDDPGCAGVFVRLDLFNHIAGGSRRHQRQTIEETIGDQFSCTTYLSWNSSSADSGF